MTDLQKAEAVLHMIEAAERADKLGQNDLAEQILQRVVGMVHQWEEAS